MLTIRRDAEIGRQTGLRIQGPQGCAGSIPVPGTQMIVILNFW